MCFFGHIRTCQDCYRNVGPIWIYQLGQKPSSAKLMAYCCFQRVPWGWSTSLLMKWIERGTWDSAMNYCACSFFATSVTFISVKPQLQRFVGSQFSNGNRSCGSSNLAEVVKLDRYLHKALAAWQGADSPFHIDWPGTITFFLGYLLQLQGGSCRVLPQFYFISWNPAINTDPHGIISHVHAWQLGAWEACLAAWHFISPLGTTSWDESWMMVFNSIFPERTDS